MVELVQDFATELTKYQFYPTPKNEKGECQCDCVLLFKKYLFETDLKNHKNLHKYALNILHMIHGCCMGCKYKASEICPVEWPEITPIYFVPCYN